MTVVVSKRPTPLGAVLAVLTVLVAVGLVGSERAVRAGLAVEAGGLVVLAAGLTAVRADRRALGAVVALLGAAVVLAGVVVPVVVLSSVPALVDVVPGAVGVAVVGAALIPLRGRGSRWVLRLGVGLAFVAVLASAVLEETTRGEQALAATLCVVGWDLGENAVSLGRQVGRSTRTWGAELTHAAGTAVVGVVGLEALSVAADVRPPASSLSSLLVLLIAALILLGAVYE